MPVFFKIKNYLFKYQILLVVTTCAAFVFFRLGVNSWKFSFIPDEWQFYLHAKAIVDQHFLVDPFDFKHGVFEQNSVLSSMYQALFMQFFGISSFSWRLSNIIFIIPISYFFYGWVKNLFNKETAIFSLLFLQCSYYLANFFKVGKNMPQALALLVLCLYMASRCVSHDSRKNFMILGILLGISFYIYIGPLFPFFMWPIFLPLLKKENRKKLIKNFLVLLLMYIIMIIPAFVNFPGLSGPIGVTIFHDGFRNGIPLHVITNILRSFTYLFTENQPWTLHYANAPYLDTVSLAFIIIGIMHVFFKFREMKYKILLLVYLSVCLFIGASASTEGIPVTRGIFFVPFGTVFAGIGLSYLLPLAVNRIRKFIIIFVFCVVFLINLYQSQIGIFDQAGHTSMTMVIKSIQEAHQNNEKNITLVISPDLGASYYFSLLPIIQQAYGIDDVKLEILHPKQLDYAFITNSKSIFVFSYDKESLSRLNSLGLASRYILLSTKITYF